MPTFTELRERLVMAAGEMASKASMPRHLVDDLIAAADMAHAKLVTADPQEYAMFLEGLEFMVSKSEALLKMAEEVMAQGATVTIKAEVTH